MQNHAQEPGSSKNMSPRSPTGRFRGAGEGAMTGI